LKNESLFLRAIDELIKFTGLKQHKQLSNMMKQQVSREMTIEKVKIAEKQKKLYLFYYGFSFI